MPQTFYTFEVCGYRVIIPYNTFPSLGCAGCHKKKKWVCASSKSNWSCVRSYLKYTIFHAWSPCLPRICFNKKDRIAWERSGRNSADLQIWVIFPPFNLHVVSRMMIAIIVAVIIIIIHLLLFVVKHCCCGTLCLNETHWMKQFPAAQEVHVSSPLSWHYDPSYSTVFIVFLVISQKNLLNLISNGIISLIKL